MAAPTNDNILPPLVFLVTLFGAFIAITLAMAPTITSNLNESWEQSPYRPPPDYMAEYYDGSWSVWNPSFYQVNDANLSDSWALDSDDGYQTTFTNALEESHPIQFSAIQRFYLSSTNITALYFYQTGGFLGLQGYSHQLSFPGDFEANFDDWGDLATYQATLSLRHAYRLILSGYNESSISLDDQIENWMFNVTLYHALSADASADPWTIVGQFFSFSLPGIPQWLNILIAAPFLIVVGVVAYILIRGALPA